METPGVVLQRICAELDDAAAVPLSCWSRDELAEWLCGLQQVRSRLDSLSCAAASEAERACVPALDGARTVRAFVAGRTRTTGADAGADLSLGRWLDQFPAVGDALRVGRITRRHALALRDLDNPRTHLRLLDAQHYLTNAAADCTWDHFSDVCTTWLLNADPDGQIPTEHHHQRRASTTGHHDGTLTGRFRLEAPTGAAVRNALDSEALRLWNDDITNNRHRTHPQRLADALVNLVTRGATRPDGTTAAPLIHIVIGEPILTEAILRAAANAAGVAPIGPDGQPLPDTLGIDPTDPLRRCELVDRTPLHPAQVVGLLSVATLRRLILGADSEILDLGRAVRTFPRHLKDALLAAQRGRCGIGNCHAPLAWLEADHIDPWTRTGVTATHNGQITCSSDNKAKGTRHGPQHNHRRHHDPGGGDNPNDDHEPDSSHHDDHEPHPQPNADNPGNHHPQNHRTPEQHRTPSNAVGECPS